MREKEIDHLLLSPRFYHKALEVSMLMLPPALETSINTANSCVCHHWREGCIVDRVHAFVTRHVHSGHKVGSSFRELGPSVTELRVTLGANETWHGHQFTQNRKWEKTPKNEGQN